jgi:undecaprenyl diphosphate synthase
VKLNPPKHVAIIMDGNGRWAKIRNLPRVAGHRAGIKVVEQIVKHALNIGLPHLTLFAFSSENWLRPKDEVNELMNLLDFYLENELPKAFEDNIKFIVSGRIENIPSYIREKIFAAINNSKNNTAMTLNLALSYGSREEILDAIKKLIADYSKNLIDAEHITEKVFSRYLYNPELPDIDLLIRTSGEKRISNFMLWQLAYTELYFTNTLWPDFSTTEFDEAIKDYLKRKRRFGLTDEQILNKEYNR